MYEDSNAGSGLYELNNNRKRNIPIRIQAAPVCNKEPTWSKSINQVRCTNYKKQQIKWKQNKYNKIGPSAWWGKNKYTVDVGRINHSGYPAAYATTLN